MKDFDWIRLFDLNSSEIGDLLRLPKMGPIIHRYIHQFPKLDLNAYIQPLSRTSLSVELTITPDFQWDTKIHNNALFFWIFVEDVDKENILHYETFILRSSKAESEHTLNFTVPLSSIMPPNIFIKAVSDVYIHCETTLPVSLKNLILPEKNPPHTDLLDLQPLPVNALKYPQAEALYNTYFKLFNPIQTQVFSTVYNSTENVLICAPPSSGKIICAEFAILKMMKHDNIRRAVYIAPYEKITKERYADWSIKFGKYLGLTVNELSGEMQIDLKTLEQSNLVVSTPDKWDYLSRRWKNRRVLQNISLFIIDELQLINSEIGPTLEVCVSRMRYISAQLQNPIRLIGLACSISNAKDIAEWIGTGSNGFFNFHPNVRTVPLEISMHGFDTYHRPSRLLSMSKPVYQAIKHYSIDKPTIIYTADRKQARLTAIDLILQTAADKAPRRFLHASSDLMEEYIIGVREKTLQEVLKNGVGYIHEGLSDSERTYIEKLFEGGIIQILIVTESLCWGLKCRSYLVIIMDTKRYIGDENDYIDYPIHDILQMMGSAARPQKDKNGIVVILCPSSTKEYYKKYIFEPLPVESQLDQHLPDFINAEIVLKTIENKQDAVDWLTWTFYYRRLKKNPNYYGLQGISHHHLSDHLSEFIENTLSTLEQSQCISIEDDVDLHALNLGLIGAFYYIKFSTIEIFNKSLWATVKRKGLLEILTAATEFEKLPLRLGEDVSLESLATSLGLRKSGKKYDQQYKALLLLYSHFNRTPLSSDLASDQANILNTALRLVQAMVDVISSNGWLQPALICMELSQMIVQALTSSSPDFSPLKQLPHFTSERIQAAQKQDINDVFDFMNMEDEDRQLLLKDLSQSEMIDVAQACNRYPVITVDYMLQYDNQNIAGTTSNAVGGIKKDSDSVETKKEVENHNVENENDDHSNSTKHTSEKHSNEITNHFSSLPIPPHAPIKCMINLERDIVADEALGPIYAPYFPKAKDEQWWLIIGRPTSNSLSAIKRLTVNKAQSSVKLELEAPGTPGKHQYVLYLMSDCYIGCDQEYKFELDVK